jgi:hypothetical protein
MAFITGAKWIGSDPPPEIAKVHQLIGQIATNWSEIEGYWYLIFTCLIPGASRKHIDAIFFLFDSSASQRVLILAAAEATYPRTKHNRIHPIRRKIGQLNARTSDLAKWRNAAVHGSLMEAYEDHTMQKLTPRIAPGSNQRRRNPLAGKDLTIELTRIGEAIEKHILELEGFLNAIAPKRSQTLPQELQQALDKLGLQEPGPATIRADPRAGS